jgi:hypothetical protein
MKYFRYETGRKKVNLYPFVCWHLGAAQSDTGFIDEMIERVGSDPDGKWVYMGDGGECVTRMSKGDVWAQEYPPGEQIKMLVKKLLPIKDKGLFFINGNHGHRLYKDVGLEFDEMAALGVGLPYLGVSAFWNLKVNKSTYSIFSHHGKDSGVSLSSKVNAAQAASAIVNADAVLTAHSHIAQALPPVYRAQLATGHNEVEPIQWRAMHQYVCGCGYDSRTGYAEEKLYPPILPAHLKIEFKGERDYKRGASGKGTYEQNHTVYMPSV